MDKHHGPGFMTNQEAPKTGSIARDGALKRHQDVALHNGMKPQPAGGRGHPVGAAPVDAGGRPWPAACTRLRSRRPMASRAASA